VSFYTYLMCMLEKDRLAHVTKIIDKNRRFGSSNVRWQESETIRKNAGAVNWVSDQRQDKSTNASSSLHDELRNSESLTVFIAGRSICHNICHLTSLQTGP
jgi:hypothetical protein